MLKISKHIAAGLLAGTAILTSQAGDAFASDPVMEMADKLLLPVGRIAHYYNRATDTAFTEKCTVESDKIKCTLKTMSNMAQLVSSQINSYELQEDGTVKITANGLGTGDWNSGLFSNEFKPAKMNATLTQWTAQSPMAKETTLPDRDILQNNVRKILEIDKDAVSGCSFVPINENRALSICAEFNAGAKTVQTSTVPQAYFANVLSIPVDVADKAVRPYEVRYDEDYYLRIGKSLQGSSPAYKAL